MGMFTPEQNAEISKIREDGLVRWGVMEARRALWEEAKAREKMVYDWAVQQEEFYMEPQFVGHRGRTAAWIIDGEDAYLMNSDEYRERFVPLVQKGYKLIYDLEYPLNYTPVWDYRKPFLEAQKAYRRTAVEFLRAGGQEEVANDLEQALNGYLPEKYAEQLDGICAGFIGIPAA